MPISVIAFYLADMKLQWFLFDDIPFDNMSLDTDRWFLHMLSGKYFDAYVLYETNEEIVKSEIMLRNNQN